MEDRKNLSSFLYIPNKRGGLSGRSAPQLLLDDARGLCPLCTPQSGRSARAWPCHARHPGDFRFTTKVTKGVSGALPLDPVGGPTEKWNTFQSHPPSDALRRSPQKREGATKGRGICHFEVVGGIGCAVSLGFEQEKYSAFNPWRGSI